MCFNRLLKLSASIQIILDEHFSDIQDLQRQFRQKMEIRLGGLRKANAQLMKNFKYVNYYYYCYFFNFYFQHIMKQMSN